MSVCKLPENFPEHARCQRVHFLSEKLSAASKQVLNSDLEPLLSRRAFNVFARLDVRRIGELIELAAKGFDYPPNFGIGSHRETIFLLQALECALDSVGNVQWAAVFESLGKPAPATHLFADDCSDSTQFPILKLSAKAFQTLCPQARALKVDNLHLDERAASTVKRLGIDTVGDFVDMVVQGLDARTIRNIGRANFADLSSAAVALAASIDASGNCDWLSFARARGFTILPSEPVELPRDVLAQLETAAEQAISAQFNAEKSFARFMDIYKSRLHGPVDRLETLEQVGRRHSITRERIRQNESQVVRCLSASLLEGCYSIPIVSSSGKTTYRALLFRFRMAVESTLQSADTAIKSDGRKVWRFDDWIQFLSQLWNSDPRPVESNALLLSVLFRFSAEAQTLDGETKTFLLVSDDVPTPVKQSFRDLLKDIQLSMQGSCERLSAAEVIEPFDFASVLREFAISPDQLLALCPALSSDREGLWKVKPEFYKPDAAKLTRDAVYEILSSQGTRMHKADIIRIFKTKYPDLFGNESVFVVRIASDARFDALNKSGFWVLSEWNKETGTIREVLDRVLKASNGPMNINDILAGVRRIVPCAESSIRHHLLHSEGKYIRLSKIVFDLASRYAGGDA
jgi:hypothetical protein